MIYTGILRDLWYGPNAIFARAQKPRQTRAEALADAHQLRDFQNGYADRAARIWCDYTQPFFNENACDVLMEDETSLVHPAFHPVLAQLSGGSHA